MLFASTVDAKLEENGPTRKTNTKVKNACSIRWLKDQWKHFDLRSTVRPLISTLKLKSKKIKKIN